MIAALTRPALPRLAVLVLALVACLVTAPAAAARAAPIALPSGPPWGACGRSTPEDKVVRQFPTGITLRCGGPLGAAEPRYGYRHILFRHKRDLERLAAGTFQNWRDVADLAMETIANDPDRSVPAPGNQICQSRVIFLNDLRTGQPVRQQVMVMYIDAPTRNVNTLTPRTTQC